MQTNRPPRYNQMPDLLYVEDVAEALKISPAAVHMMCSRGDLVMAKRTKRLVIPKEDFLEWLRENMRERRAQLEMLRRGRRRRK